MALRIRLDGKIVCASINDEEKGDVYIDDDLHYEMSVVKKIIVTSPDLHHMSNGGEWWWKGREPKGIEIDNFYSTNK